MTSLCSCSEAPSGAGDSPKRRAESPFKEGVAHRLAPPRAWRRSRRERKRAGEQQRLRVRGLPSRGHVGRGPDEADAGSGNACPRAGRGGAAQQECADWSCALVAPEDPAVTACWPGTGSTRLRDKRAHPAPRLGGGCRPSHAARDGGAHPVVLMCSLWGRFLLASCQCAPAGGPQGGSWGHPCT